MTFCTIFLYKKKSIQNNILDPDSNLIFYTNFLFKKSFKINIIILKLILAMVTGRHRRENIQSTGFISIKAKLFLFTR